MNGSVLKINASRHAMPDEAQAGYRELIIASDVSAASTLADPEGNRVTFVPRGHGGVAGIAVEMAVRQLAAAARFYGEALQFERIDAGCFRCGDSLLLLDEAADVAQVGRMTGRGYRYITVQVRDVDREHADIVARGGREGRPPITLGTTARISFVRDPDGNWIEVSQRASLTGSLA
jgi:lactoylglutathione lyase